MIWGGDWEGDVGVSIYDGEGEGRGENPAFRRRTNGFLFPQATKLCESVRKYHFQLLVLLGSYVKLVDMLKGIIRRAGVSAVGLKRASV